ncbi:MAG: hypothetical protein ACP5XB_03935 [Isosphaeraceae bacterium]
MLRGLAIIILTACASLPSQLDAQTLPVPESIRAEGVPPVPAALAAELNRYQNIRSARFQDWDQNGSRAMYITTRFADTPQVHYLASPGGSRRQLTFFDNRVLGVAARPKYDQFLFEKDEGGAENNQLFLQDRASGATRRITDGKSRNIAPAWSRSGEILAWSSNARDGRNLDLYLAAPADTHFQRRLKEVSGQWTVADWSPDGTKVIAEEYISINEACLHIIDITTGQTTTITPRRTDPKAEPVFAGSPRWAKDGKSIFFISDEKSEFRRLVQYDRADGLKRASLTRAATWDVEEFDLNDDGKTIAVVVNENGTDVVYLTHPTEAPGQFAPAGFRSGQISALKFRRGSQEFGVSSPPRDSSRGRSRAWNSGEVLKNWDSP